MDVMKKICIAAVTVLAMAPLRAQDNGVVVDYNNPRVYVVDSVAVEGNNYFSDQQIIQNSGLQKGMEVTVPGEDISSIVKRLWMQRFFDDVSVGIDSVGADGRSALFKIYIKERPRVSRWTFSGVRKGEEKDLMDRLSLRRGGEFSDYVAASATNVIKNYFAEKGFLKASVDITTVEDTIIHNAIRVNFAIDKGKKIKVKTINFSGNTSVSDYKLARSMKKTKSSKFYNFFSSKKFDEKEYPNDKRNLISAFNEAGYRDARILKDSIYYVEPDRLGIDFEFDEGNKYYFRNISWTGNSVYSADMLNGVLGIQKVIPMTS